MTHIKGVIFSQKRPMPLTPPISTTPQIAAQATVVTQVGMPKT